ncbi:MAG: hypothetical protein JWP37_31 [Mucilaginibacter sp.]|nr:hypothetical protein [Mucilaginibacter sp.]
MSKTKQQNVEQKRLNSLSLMEEARLNVLIKEKENDYPNTGYSVEEALTVAAGKYFWLPIYKMLKKQKIINSRLVPGEILMENDFAFVSFTRTVEGLECPFPKEEFFVTSGGLDFIMTWIEYMVWGNDELYPEWYAYKEQYS